MRPAQAKEQRGAAPPPAPDPATGARPPGGQRADAGRGAVLPDAPGAARPAATGGPRLVAADPPAAVGRALGHVLDERAASARAGEELFRGDVAERITGPAAPNPREPRR
ncbi:hypothetical protein [Streptomyces mexicanus]|jgi:hypothetical protein|uniref:hypothetical protein n=1 Tax=Streptomyces mexicanus TaxID=178566 RepID=UPI0031F128D0